MTQQNGHANSERETVSGERFDGERILIDEKHFEDCHFETCTLVYRGGTPPNFAGCDFTAPRFVFEEAAQSTLRLMSAIYDGIDERIIGKTFDEIRKGFGDRWTSKGFGRTALFRFKYTRTMEGKIYVMEDGNLHALSESTYDAEGKLQKLLRDHPDLLAGEQMTSAEPRRWVLADREFGISDDESSGSRWALDHLFLDQDGIPTLVEVKRSSNRELRRQVVGQIRLRRQRDPLRGRGSNPPPLSQAARGARGEAPGTPWRHRPGGLLGRGPRQPRPRGDPHGVRR
jgi:hypothetical protein